MSGVWRGLSAAVVVLSLMGTGWAQVDRFGGRADVVVVEIPVQVIRGGRPVRGLTADNFRVFQGKERQEIVGFDVVDLELVETADEAARVPISARRHFLLLFDLSFSAPASVIKAQQAAHKLVLDGLHDSDLVAVATYAESRGAELALGFTSDRRQIDAALDSLGLIDPVNRRADPLKLIIAPGLDQTVASGQGLTVGPGGALNTDAVFLEVIRDLTTFTARGERAQQIDQILNLSGSLEELATYMTSASGRKHVVFLSEGFDSSIILGLDNKERQAEISSYLESGQVWRSDSDERFGNSEAQGGLFEMLEAFRRCDCAIQAVDIGGVRAGFRGGEAVGADASRQTGQDGLFIMANQTGGDFYRNYNDLSEAMGTMLDRTGVTYVLSIAPENLPHDGSYRPLTVRLKGVPKAARAVHRPGFFAPKAYADQTPEERRFKTAEMIRRGDEGGQLTTSLLAVPFEGEGGKSHVTAYFEVDGYSLRAGHTGRELPTEIFAYAIDSGGATRDFFSQGVLLDLAEVGPRLDARGFKFIGHFELQPGRYEVRALARNAVTGATGLSRTQVDVPAFGDQQPSLQPPLFIEPHGLWLLGEANAEGAAAVGNPLAGGSRPAIPATQPILSRDIQIPMTLLGHHLGAGNLTAIGRLISVDGTPHPVDVSLEARQPATGAERLSASVVASGMLPGNYRFEVDLTNESSGLTVSSGISVTVF